MNRPAEQPARDHDLATHAEMGPFADKSPAELDFDQWRLDIQTFICETNRELESIIAQLTKESGAGAGPQSANISALDELVDAANKQAELTRKYSPFNPANFEPTAELPPDNTLAALKQKLAHQIQQSTDDSF